MTDGPTDVPEGTVPDPIDAPDADRPTPEGPEPTPEGSEPNPEGSEPTPDGPGSDATDAAAPGRPPVAAYVLGGILTVGLIGGVVGGVVVTQEPTTPAVAAVADPAEAPVVEVVESPSPSPAPATPRATPSRPARPSAGATPTPTPTATPSRTPTPQASSSRPTQEPQQDQQQPSGNQRMRVDPAWLSQVSGVTGIPVRQLEAYAMATVTVNTEKPACGIGWNTVAAIGSIESRHGSINGARVGADGYVTPAILGPQLNGNGFAAIPDTDRGALDGDTVWDRAVGPMQFIPSTWARWAADGNGDGQKNPHQYDDATLAAARYLCAMSPTMTTADGWRTAIFAYNRSDAYVNNVANTANGFARQVGG